MNKDFLATVYLNGEMVTQSFLHLKNGLNLNHKEKQIPRKLLDLFDSDTNGNLVLLTEKLKSSDYITRGTLELDDPKSKISHGDYQVFKGKRGETYRILFIDPNEIQLGFKEYTLVPSQRIRIGSSLSNEICFSLHDMIAPTEHLVLNILSNGKAIIEDRHPNSGLFINGKLENKKELELFDEIFFLGLSIVYLGDALSIRQMNLKTSLIEQDKKVKFENPTPNSKEYFQANPRILPSYNLSSIEIDSPPSKQSMETTPALLRFGPSATMGIVTLASAATMLTSAFQNNNLTLMVSSGAMAIGSLTSALLWPKLLDRHNKQTTQRKEETRQTKYQKYIENIDKDLSQKAQEIRTKMNTINYPAPDILCTFLSNPNLKKRLWERSREDEDFLHIRLGQGTQAFPIEIQTKKLGFQLEEDDLQLLPTRLKNKYSTLDKMPVVLDIFHNNQIGLIGSKESVNQTLHRILLNLIALHSPQEVKIVILSKEEEAQSFKDYSNVPHLWNNEKQVRFFAQNPQEIHTLLNAFEEIFQERKEEREENHYKGDFDPYFVFVVLDPELFEENFFRFFDGSNNDLGFTILYSFQEFGLLPKSTQAIIQTSTIGMNGFYIKNKNKNQTLTYYPDSYDAFQEQEFLKSLTSLSLKRSASFASIPQQVSFLEVLRMGNIEQFDVESHWKNNNSHRSLAAPIGLKAGNEIFSLDIHENYHGAHGLVAGTTGSGKSEFLQALVLSLAAHYSPQEIGFVLIDFKGGDMARPFLEKKGRSALPHLAATISNLSGNILQRALISLRAEIDRREHLFNQAAKEIEVDKININSYHRFYKEGRLKEPLPHLVIVIDEFAQLRAKNSEFLEQLKDIAQVGRSLGIHLILATQKPDGIVDPQILSNSRFRVCLKVAQKEDSLAVINRPDAARIKNPGRLYLQVGYDELYECLQAGYTGSPYRPSDQFISEEELTLQVIDGVASPIYQARLNLTTQITDDTEMERFVDTLANLGDKLNLKVKPLWMDPLKERIDLKEISTPTKGLASASLGLVDVVSSQQQVAYSYDFIEQGSLVLYGQAGSGKSVALQTILYSMITNQNYHPNQLQFTLLDFRGRSFDFLKNSPYFKEIVYPAEPEKVVEVLDRLEEMVEERKLLFSSMGVSNYQTFRETYPDQSLEAEIIIINGYGDLFNTFYKENERFIQLAFLGQSYGISFLITAMSKTDLPSKLKQAIPGKLALTLPSRDDYFDIFEKRPLIYPEEIPGRGLISMNQQLMEIQIALVHSEIEFEARRLKMLQKELLTQSPTQRPQEITSEKEKRKKEEKKSTASSSISNKATGNSSILHSNYSRLKPIQSSQDALSLATSPSGNLHYGLEADQGYKVAVFTTDPARKREFFQRLIEKTQSSQKKTDILFIDHFEAPDPSFKQLIESGLYSDSSQTLLEIILRIQDEVNARRKDRQACQSNLIIMIEDYQQFFEGIDDRQADFFRNALRFIEKGLGIYFITGYDAHDPASIDLLFSQLLLYSEAKIIDENSYDLLSTRIETLPSLISSQRKRPQLFVQDELTEISWRK